MSWKEDIQNALIQRPDTKEMWINSEDYKRIESEHPCFINSLGLILRINEVIESKTFLLSDKDTEKEMESYLSPIPMKDFKIEWVTKEGLDIAF